MIEEDIEMLEIKVDLLIKYLGLKAQIHDKEGDTHENGRWELVKEEVK